MYGEVLTPDMHCGKRFLTQKKLTFKKEYFVEMGCYDGRGNVLVELDNGERRYLPTEIFRIKSEKILRNN